MEANQIQAELARHVEQLLGEAFAQQNRFGEGSLEGIERTFEEIDEMISTGNPPQGWDDSVQSYERCRSLFCQVLMELEILGWGALIKESLHSLHSRLSQAPAQVATAAPAAPATPAADQTAQDFEQILNSDPLGEKNWSWEAEDPANPPEEFLKENSPEAEMPGPEDPTLIREIPKPAAADNLWSADEPETKTDVGVAPPAPSETTGTFINNETSIETPSSQEFELAVEEELLPPPAEALAPMGLDAPPEPPPAPVAPTAPVEVAPAPPASPAAVSPEIPMPAPPAAPAPGPEGTVSTEPPPAAPIPEPPPAHAEFVPPTPDALDVSQEPAQPAPPVAPIEVSPSPSTSLPGEPVNAPPEPPVQPQAEAPPTPAPPAPPEVVLGGEVLKVSANGVELPEPESDNPVLPPMMDIAELAPPTGLELHSEEAEASEAPAPIADLPPAENDDVSIPEQNGTENHQDVADFFRQLGVQGTAPFSPEAANRYQSLAQIFALEEAFAQLLRAPLAQFESQRRNALAPFAEGMPAGVAESLHQVAQANPDWSPDGVKIQAITNALQFMGAASHLASFEPAILEAGVLVFFFGQNGHWGEWAAENPLNLSGLTQEETAELLFRCLHVQRVRNAVLRPGNIISSVEKIEQSCRRLAELIHKMAPLSQVA